MVAVPATPGVHVQRADPGPPRQVVLRTDITGFAGFAERGPVGEAVALESMAQFEAVFGTYLPGAELAYAVRGFFENDGARCRVTRIASEAPEVGAAPAALPVLADDGSLAFTLLASSPGRWGNGLTAALRALVRAEAHLPPQPRMDRSDALSVDGFESGDLVRLSQPGAPDIYRLLTGVDRSAGVLVWLRGDLRDRQPWEAPLAGFDPARPIRAARVVHEIVLRDLGRPVAVYGELGLHPAGRRFIGDVLGPVVFARAGADPVAPVTVQLPEAHPGAVPRAVAPEHAIPRALTDGRDGHSAATLADFIGRPGDGPAYPARGLHALAEARDVSLIAAPDLVGPRPAPPVFDRPDPRDPCLPCPLPDAPAAPGPYARAAETPPRYSAAEIARGQAALITLCEGAQDRIALLDPPWPVASCAARGLEPALGWRSGTESSYAAALFPWVVVPDPAQRGGTRPVPPSGHVAGRIAAEDRRRGVPGSGANAPFGWITDTSAALDAAAHGRLNEAGINAITVAHGRATRLGGARLASRDPAWRFVTPRRLVCAMRRHLPALLDWAVFAPNDAATRLDVARQITVYLEMLRRRGALAGATPREAYEVRCDETTTTAQDEADGRLVARVAIAPSVPFEFLVLRLGRIDDRFEIADQGGGLGPLVSEAAP